MVRKVKKLSRSVSVRYRRAYFSFKGQENFLPQKQATISATDVAVVQPRSRIQLRLIRLRLCTDANFLDTGTARSMSVSIPIFGTRAAFLLPPTHRSVCDNY